MKSVKQFTTVHHIELGKGQVVALTPRGKDSIVMCYFPNTREHDWVLLSALQTGTDDYIALTPMVPQEDAVSDELKDLITQAFFGGQPPQGM